MSSSQTLDSAHHTDLVKTLDQGLAGTRYL